MHLVYSAFQQQPVNIKRPKKMANIKTTVSADRYLAHQVVCERYKEEIAAIQKYLPDWKPTWNLGR